MSATELRLVDLQHDLCVTARDNDPVQQTLQKRQRGSG